MEIKEVSFSELSASSTDRFEIFKGTSGGILRVDGQVVGMAFESPDVTTARFLRADQIKSELARLIEAQVDTAALQAGKVAQTRAAEQARLQLEKAGRASDGDDAVLAAKLALSALEFARGGGDLQLKSSAATTLYSNLINIAPPDVDFSIEGLPQNNEYDAHQVFSGDGSKFAFDDGLRGVKIYDVFAGALIQAIKAPDKIKDLRFSEDGARLLLTGEEELWRVDLRQKGTAWESFGLSSADADKWEFSPGGEFVIDMSDKKKLVLKGLKGARFGKPMLVPAAPIIAVTSLNERFIVAKLANKEFHVFDARSGQRLWKKKFADEYAFADFSRDGSKLLISPGLAGAPLVVDVNGWTERPLLARFDRDQTRVTIFLDPEGEHAASVAPDQTVSVWETRTGKVLRTLTGVTDHIGGLSAVDGGSLLVAHLNEKGIAVWRTKTGERVATPKGDLNRSHLHTLHNRPMGLVVQGDRIQSVALSPSGVRLTFPDDQTVNLTVSGDGRRVVTTNSAETLLWDTRTGDLIKDLTLKERGVPINSALAFSRDGATLLIGPSSESGGTVRAVRTENGAELRRFLGAGAVITSIGFSRVDDDVFSTFGHGEFFVGRLTGTFDLRGAFVSKGLRAVAETPGPDGPNVRAAFYSHDGTIGVAEFDGPKASMLGRFKAASRHVGDVLMDRSGDTVIAYSGAKVSAFSLSRGAEISAAEIRGRLEGMTLNEAASDLVNLIDERGKVYSWRWRTNELRVVSETGACSEAELHGSLRLCRTENYGMKISVVEDQIIDLFATKDDLAVSGDGKFAVLQETEPFVSREGERIKTGFTKRFAILPLFQSLDEFVAEARRRLAPFERASTSAGK